MGLMFQDTLGHVKDFKNECGVDENSTIEVLKGKAKYIKENDIFYKRRFLLHTYKFPYMMTFFRFMGRYSEIILNLLIYKIYNIFGLKNNIRYFNNAFARVVKDNINDSYKMYNDVKYTELFYKLIHDFKKRLETKGRKLILLVIPQLHDIKNAKKEKITYQLFFDKIKKEINIIDLTNSIKDLSNYKNYYLEDKHGGHFSPEGNRLVAELILNDIKKMVK